MSNNDYDDDVKVVVNPYNFNNKMIQESDITDILKKYDIDDNIVNLDIYQKAFIHKSYSRKDPKDLGENVEIADKPEGALELFEYNNETLEFLGDAVISTVVARYLLERFHGQNEGFLTKMRSKLVNGEMLGNLAYKMGFGELIIISRHIEDKCNGRTNPNILEDSFEAFIGAMFLDFNEVDNYNLLDNFYTGIGYQMCEKILINIYEDLVNFTELIMTNTNYKEQIGRYFNETYGHSVRYGELLVTGISTEREHTCCVFVPNYDPSKLENGKTHDESNIFVKATGTSRKKGEQAAAKMALQKLNLIDI
jgi:dsRNA-specific ribonuclease